MKNLILVSVIAAALVWGDRIQAAGQTVLEYYQVQSKQVTKLEAIRVLIGDRSAQVYRCTMVELTDKVTLRKRKP